ncbi:sugar phosphate isomerase/epimerase [Gottfriedia acidiceleris]|uniref:sugar phosphate isomerase/epimerase family protein n=1 Tax=Bacillaceae TaxID=186817 RepID=UPI000BEB515C|nr:MULTISPECIES: sugar phosphate isomerase/epimerase [unclassified Bacillus (in: firmicutes)]PEC50316.1 xylose isomerase [Bacillus sp. AFS096315]PFM74950.1 xylose isomerase [Bacillus sp. AFS077874]
MKNVIVPLNAFDRIEVLEKGHSSFVELIAQSGAFGVEIRHELLPVENPQLDIIRRKIDQFGLFTIYSVPIECWKEDYQLNEEHLMQVFDEGRVLGAKWIKISLGHFNKDVSDVLELKNFLNHHQDVQLLIENDQTYYGGNVHSLTSFFESVTELDIPVKMTFDAGNWYFCGQDVEEALSKLAPYVIYLHLKQVEEHDGSLQTLPVQTEGNLSWMKVMKSFPVDIVKALEFPIEPKEKTKEYIYFVTELATESGALSCDN